MTSKQVIVVGAGMAGLSTAWFLQRAGAEVTVLDRRDVAAGSSWGNAGWLSPALTLPLPEPAILAPGLRALLSAGSPVYIPPTLDPRLLRFLAGFVRHCTPRQWNRAMAVFAQANKLALDAYDRMGGATGRVEAEVRPADPLLAVFRSATDRAALVEEFDRVGRVTEPPEYRLVDRDEIQELEPILSSSARFGVRLSGQRFLNPGEFVHALADSVKNGGGQILTGLDVRGVTGGRRAGVRLADGSSLAADAVVVAAGGWLSRLVRPHGVRTPVQAGRGYSFTVRPGVAVRNPIYLPAQRVACTPLGGPAEGVRVAGMMEFRRPDAALDPRRVRAIVTAATPLVDGVDWEARTDEWVGSRPCTPDGLPLVGRTSSSRVFVAGGHGMWGMALGPLTGRLLADQIMGERVHPLMDAFDPLR